jgi:hypothetical protein
MSLRQQIIEKIEKAIREVEEPRVSFVTREPFNVLEIAITQFPAVLITFIEETRSTITMGQNSFGRRQGEILVNLRCYVRGNELDGKRNLLLEAIEEQLEKNRNLELQSSGVTDTQVTRIEVIERMPPLAEFLIEVTVRYNYLRGNT